MQDPYSTGIKMLLKTNTTMSEEIKLTSDAAVYRTNATGNANSKEPKRGNLAVLSYYGVRSGYLGMRILISHPTVLNNVL